MAYMVFQTLLVFLMFAAFLFGNKLVRLFAAISFGIWVTVLLWPIVYSIMTSY